jgi:hypothetical protein
VRGRERESGRKAYVRGSQCGEALHTHVVFEYVGSFGGGKRKDVPPF